MAVTHLSLDDINQVRSSSSAQDSFSAVHSSEKPKQTSSFVSRLTDDQITKFFEPYGLIDFERMVDAGEVRGIYARCLDFVCSFSDFDVIVWMTDDMKALEVALMDYIDKYKDFPKFNMESFKLYCESIETTPERAIESRIVTELLGGLKKYNETHTAFVRKRLDEQFANIPAEYQKLLTSAKDDQKLLADKDELMQIIKKYGSLDNIEVLTNSNQ